MMQIKNILIICLALLFIFEACKKAPAVDNNKDTTDTYPIDEEIVSPPNSVFKTSVPKNIFDIIAVRPTNTSVTLSILAYKTCNISISYYAQNSQTKKEISISLAANVPKEIMIDGLQQATTYEYIISYKILSTNTIGVSPKYTFCTARPAGNSFSFAILADSHLDNLTDTTTYLRTLANIVEDKNDFMIDLGDTYMNDKYGKDFSMAFYNYLAQRYFLSAGGQFLPYYFVQGNHDGEYGFYNDGTSQSWAVWSNLMRKKYFPMPEPDGFYSGNTEKDVFAGYLQDYYSWNWGNALFIVLDPFWYTMSNGQQEPWNRTLGATQYNWLKNTLEKSTAKFKFIFIHHLVGGFDVDGKARGGAEAAKFYEWGGSSPDGQVLFQQKRSGWEMPIHDLLKKYGVNAVFHGHDHFYAYQPFDAIVYQEVPQPGSPENIKPTQAPAYGYQQGTILGGTGYLRIQITPSSVLVEYRGTSIKNTGSNKAIVHSYSFK